jgi:hypothetical protein
MSKQVSAMRIDPSETLLVATWVLYDGRVVNDDVANRISSLTESHLIKVEQDASGWDSLYRDPIDGRLWELVYPESHMHGGGPPRLQALSTADAVRKYGAFMSGVTRRRALTLRHFVAMEMISQYWEWIELEGVYLEDSYVLAIVELPTTVVFRMLLVLTEEHPDYVPPETGDQYCYRPGAIEFLDVRNVIWERRSDQKYVDRDGEEDLGNIDLLFRADGEFEAEGDWGKVRIQAAHVALTMLAA